jgi:hypothetical protein
MSKGLITSEMIWNELQEIKRTLRFMKEQNLKHSIEAAKYIKKSPEFLKQEVESGKLPAIVSNDDNNKRYRFRIRDLVEWQNKRIIQSQHSINTIHIDPNWAKNFAEDFHKKHKKKGAVMKITITSNTSKTEIESPQHFRWGVCLYKMIDDNHQIKIYDEEELSFVSLKSGITFEKEFFNNVEEIAEEEFLTVLGRVLNKVMFFIPQNKIGV